MLSHPFDSALALATAGGLAIVGVTLLCVFWFLLDLVLIRLSARKAARASAQDRARRAESFNQARAALRARLHASSATHPRKDDPHHAA